MQDMYQLKQIPSEPQIRRFFRRTLFGKNVWCPDCRSRSVVRYEGRYRCQRCRAKFSLLSHTWLADLKLSLPKFWLVLWCWTSAVPVKQAMALAGLSDEAVRRWYDRFRCHLPADPVILERLVQMDEAYGKGWALLMGKQLNTRKVAYAVIPERTVQRHHAHQFLAQHVRPRSRLHTDGAAIYQGIHRWWPVRHARDIHARWEFAKTSEIEGLFGNLRTFLRRMYHHVTAEKLPAYVGEFCARFSSPEIFENPQSYLKKSLTRVPID